MVTHGTSMGDKIIIPELELEADEIQAASISGTSSVGKIISKNKLGRNVVFMITKRVWFTQHPMGVDQLGPNLSLFSKLHDPR